ncbi:MAG TPA: amidase family protein, partial [Salinarimonas sp.]|nr:amidase family protein [Salinarimonas sp.]
MTDPTRLDGAALAAAFRAGGLSPTELTDALLDRIDALEPAVNAFVLVDHAGARAAAAASQARWRRGEPLGPLDGVPVTIKDNILWAGHPMRRGSRTASDDPATESGARSPRRVRRDAAYSPGVSTGIERSALMIAKA